MTIRSLTPLVAAVLLAAAPRRAEACSCARPPPPKQAMEGATAVFEGKIVKLDRAPDKHRLTATLTVTRWWKGGAAAEVTVSTADMDAACGLEFEAGEAWLLYASGPADELQAGLCSRSRLVEDATADLAALGAGTAPGSTPAPTPAAPASAPAPASTPAPTPAPAAAPAPAPEPPPVEAKGCSQVPRDEAGLGLVLAVWFAGRRRKQ